MNYEEKLKLAREALKSDSYDKKTIEYIFPELKESKDEEIRKRIILCLEECVHNDIIRDYEKDECLAWLEKQGEQKPIKWENDDCATLENWITIVEKYKDDWELRDWFVDATKDVVRKIKWILSNNQELLDESFSEENRDNWIKENGEKKSVEWSEEDEKMLNDIIYSGDHHCQLTIKETDWLKSLKGRCIYQPKQDWSEEDEKIKKEIIHYLEINNDQMTPDQNQNFRNSWLPWLNKQSSLMRCLQIANGRIGELIEENYYLKEQKIHPKFKIGDEIIPKNRKESSLTITNIIDTEYYSEDLLICRINEQDEWELVDQKPMERTRKFKVGDIVQYITDSTDRRRIEEVDELCNMYHTDDLPIMFEVEDEWKVVVNAKDDVEEN